MKAKFESEMALAKAVREWLIGDHWEVYQEVACAGSVCDLVAKRGPVLWAIECKLSLNLEVLTQATKWRYRAHLVSVACPNNEKHRNADQILVELGIGCIMLCPPSPHSYSMPRSELGRYMRPKPKCAIKVLEAHKTFCEAGGNRGGYYTPFKETARRVQEFVAANPGATAKGVIDGIDHHYKTAPSARAAILELARRGIIKGVRVDDTGKTPLFYPREPNEKPGENRGSETKPQI